MASYVILNYKSEILGNVRSVLWEIKERGGLVSNAFLDEQWAQYKGQWNDTVLNVALCAMGRKVRYIDEKCSSAQLEILVEHAKQDNADILHEIAALRAAKGK